MWKGPEHKVMIHATVLGLHVPGRLANTLFYGALVQVWAYPCTNNYVSFTIKAWLRTSLLRLQGSDHIQFTLLQRPYNLLGHLLEQRRRRSLLVALPQLKR